MDSTYLLLDLPVSEGKGLDKDRVHYSFKKVEHAKVLLKNLALMQASEGLLTDVVLRSTSKDYGEPFHSILLAACSPIKQNLTGKHFDCTGGTLSLKELTTDVLIAFRDFIYKSEFPSDEELVDALQTFADTHGIDSLVKLFDEYKNDRNSDEEILVLLNSHTEGLLSQLYEMYKKSELTTTLLEDGKGATQLAVHAPVVAAASPALREILSNELLSSEETTYRLKGVAPDILKDLIEYIYTGDVTLKGENVVGLLNVACSYEIPALTRACCDWLSLKLDSYNAVNILWLAQSANSKETKVLEDDAKSFIIANFASVCEEAEFVELEYEDLKEIIQHDNLCVDCEEDVLYAVAKWVCADEDGRSPYMPVLLQCIRLENTSEEFLLNLKEDPLIKKSVKCVELVQSALETRASFHHVVQENTFTAPTVFDEYEQAFFPGQDDSEDAIVRNLVPEFSKSESELPGSEGLSSQTPKRGQRKNGAPDMRLKENRRLSGMQNKDNSPDMRFKVNKEGLNLPLKKDGAADMRSKVHRQSLGKDDERRPLKKDGTPDRRFKVTRDKEATVRSSSQSGSTSCTGPVKKDGTPDMRYAVNKKPNSLLTTSQTSNPMERSSHASCPVKKDGTPDMRYAVNKQSASPPFSSYGGSSSQLSSYSSSSGPVKRDGTPDMRYAANKSYGSSPASSGYSSGGSSYSSISSSSRSVSGSGSRGPLKSDGTPDMRYTTNKSSYGSPLSFGCSSGGSSYSSRSSSSGGTYRSSSGGPLKSNGTPDMRFKANRR